MRVALATLLFASIVSAQDKEETSLFVHSNESPVWLSGQINVVHQQHPDFFAKYSGVNSFIAEREKATSRVMTLYTGARVTHGTDILLDVESSGGQGLSEALGMAGFVNLDVVRKPTLGSTPEGHHESFAYTEVNNTIALGGDLLGKRWHRASDKIGLAFVSNGISLDHRRYLQLGGLGFLLGDGNLTYGREKIIEGYYTARIMRGVYAAPDLQYVTNPGYNRDRGPVFVPGVRLHLEF